MNLFKRNEGTPNGDSTQNDQLSGTGNKTLFDVATRYIFFGIIFLLPIIFIPVDSVPFQFTKTFLIFVGVLIVLLVTILSRLKEGTLTVPHHPVLYAVWGLTAVYCISAIFSDNPGMSLSGLSLDIDTVAFIALMAVFVSLVVVFFRKREDILTSYLVLFLSFIIVWVFQGLRLIFGADFLSFDTLTFTTSNLLGKWNDLSIFFGLATVMLLTTLGGLPLSGTYRAIMYAMLVVSLFFIAVVNFVVTWVVIGIFALAFLVYHVSRGYLMRRNTSENPLGGPTEGRGMSLTNAMLITPFIVLIASAVFIFANDTVGVYFAEKFNISQIEARPSWQSTIDIAKQTYDNSALLGSGPNTFVKQWALARPLPVNESIFWNADFIAGIGNVPTSFVSVGIIGGLLWLSVLVLFLYSGVRSLLMQSSGDTYTYFLSLSSFLAGTYLWVFMIVYTPNAVLVTLTFFFMGIYLATLRYRGANKLQEKTFVFAGNAKTGFVFVLGLTFLLLVCLVSLYGTVKVYASSVLFQKGILALNRDGNLDAAEEYLIKSVEYHETDRGYRALSDISVARLLALQTETDVSPEELRARFQSYLTRGIEMGQTATEQDETQYQNWLARGRVYQAVVPLRIQGAYENALQSYTKAAEFNPNGPVVYLTLARLEADRGDLTQAREHLTEALRLKSNYTEAIFLLSQIEISEGNVNEAIRNIEAAAVLTQNNPVIFFQLGILKYNQFDNQGAIAALEMALALNNDYANARYFLGLAYDRVGRKDDAVRQFEDVERLNPDNEEVKKILENLRAGRRPFADIVPTPPTIPDELPIEETTELGEGVDPDAEGALDEDTQP